MMPDKIANRSRYIMLTADELFFKVRAVPRLLLLLLLPDMLVTQGLSISPTAG